MTGDALRALALALPGTTEAPHFDRAAFRVKRIYATLAADGGSANLMLTPEEQAHYCDLRPDLFAPLPNAWGARGATSVALALADPGALAGALDAAWRKAGGRV